MNARELELRTDAPQRTGQARAASDTVTDDARAGEPTGMQRFGGSLLVGGLFALLFGYVAMTMPDDPAPRR